MGEKGEYDRAIVDYDLAIQLDLAEAYVFYDRGIAHYAIGEIDRAIADYDRAIQVEPNNAETYFQRSIAYIDKQEWDRVIADSTKAIQLKADYGEAYASRAAAHVAKGNRTAAIDDLRAAARLLPDNHPTRSIVLEALSDLESAPPVVAAKSTGTGIVVASEGRVLTNNHVIEDCSEIQIRRSGDVPIPATLLFFDSTNDLALLKIDTHLEEREVASLRTVPSVRGGETAAVFGFPFADFLSSSGNIVGGNISALAGLADDVRHFQMTNPIQPGNSGGPLLDKSANVIGIVQSKLDEMTLQRERREFPQTVNFAIKANVAVNFLEAHNVTYKASLSHDILDLPAIADIARRFTVQVVCR